MKQAKTKSEPYVSTTNACKMCNPLGACLAFRGVEGAVPFLHGSQGCATYMRRYIISHYREPMDIASSSLGEKHAVYGGGANLKLGLKNVMDKYEADVIGIATTCLTETIGDNVPLIVNEFRAGFEEFITEHGSPALVNVSTPSFAGTHVEGFHAAVRAIVEQLAAQSAPSEKVALLPGFVSPADIRYLREVLEDFAMDGTILPDISLSLDAPILSEYEKLPSGGTPVADIIGLGDAKGAIEFGGTLPKSFSAGALLNDKFDTPLYSVGTPIGLRETDEFFQALETISGVETPLKHALERGRLIDSYVDGHKYIFEKRALVYGDPDLVVGLNAFLAEIGVRPIMVATGVRAAGFEPAIRRVLEGVAPEIPEIRTGVDFYTIAEEAEALKPDLVIGNSKGYRMARQWKIPLIRVGFPIHDRFGGHRTLHLGYRGAQGLLDRIVNTVIELKQENSTTGYSYI